MVAWIITEVPNPTEVIVTVLNHRLSSSSVGSIMERIYAERRLGLSALLEHAKTGKTPAPWRLASLNGIPWSDEVWCGSGDRFYWGRKVDGLKVIENSLGSECLTWTERKRPDFSHIREALGLSSIEMDRHTGETDI